MTHMTPGALRLSAVLLLLAAFAAAPHTASGTLDCQCVSIQNQPDDHHLFSESGDRDYKCDTAGCHTTSRDLLCSSEHAGCGGGGFEDGFAAAERIEDAVRSLETAVALAGMPGVVYNPMRQAVQVIDCNGLVKASARVPDAYVLAVIEAWAFKYV